MKTAIKTLACFVLVVLSFGAQASTYYLRGDDGYQQSSMSGQGSPAGWAETDGGAKKTTSATAGNDYIVDHGYNIRTPQQDGSYTFQGDSLTFVNGSIGHKILKSTGKFTINNMIVAENGCLIYSVSAANDTTHWLAGKVTVRAGGQFVVASSATRPARIDADISGSGSVYVKNAGSASDASAYLNGDNSGLTGTLVCSNRVLGVVIGKAASCPGETPQPEPAGIRLYNTTLCFEDDCFIGPNRGITIEGGAVSTIAVKTNFTTTVLSPVVCPAGTVLHVGTSGYTGVLKLTHASPDLAGTIQVDYGTLLLIGDAKELLAKCQAGAHGTILVAADTFSTVAYVDMDVAVTNGPPYDTPARATTNFLDAIASLYPGGTLYIAGKDATHKDKRYRFTDQSVKFDSKKVFTVIGPEDCSAVFEYTHHVLNAGQTWRNVMFSLGNSSTGPQSDRRDMKTDGMVILKSGAVVSNCVFWGSIGTSLRAEGGLVIDSFIRKFAGCGVYCAENSNARFVNTHIYNSEAYPWSPRTAAEERSTPISPVLCDQPCAPVFERCVIYNNRISSGYGAGAISWSGNPPDSGLRLVLDRCVISNNTGRAGAIRVHMATGYDSQVAMTNCLIVGNVSQDVITSDSGTLSAFQAFGLMRGTMVNCTVASNQINGSVLSLGHNNTDKSETPEGVFSCVNTVISGNTSVATPGVELPAVSAGVGTAWARYSMLPEATNATDRVNGNIAGPAVFMETCATPYKLAKKSVGTSAGDASVWAGRTDATDLEGLPRVSGSSHPKIDMGCYQWMLPGGLVLLVR